MIRALIVAVLLTACNRGPVVETPSERGYQAEYGGSSAVYAQIAADTDCDSLQATFDQAAANNDAAAPGTDQHRWTTGYMAAANARLREIGCY